MWVGEMVRINVLALAFFFIPLICLDFFSPAEFDSNSIMHRILCSDLEIVVTMTEIAAIVERFVATHRGDRVAIVGLFLSTAEHILCTF